MDRPIKVLALQWGMVGTNSTATLLLQSSTHILLSFKQKVRRGWARAPAHAHARRIFSSKILDP
jgi:hypothetical protein